MRVPVSDFVLSETVSSQTNTGWDFLVLKSADAVIYCNLKNTYNCGCFQEIMQSESSTNNGFGDLDDNDVGVANGHEGKRSLLRFPITDLRYDLRYYYKVVRLFASNPSCGTHSTLPQQVTSPLPTILAGGCLSTTEVVTHGTTSGQTKRSQTGLRT